MFGWKIESHVDFKFWHLPGTIKIFQPFTADTSLRSILARAQNSNTRLTPTFTLFIVSSYSHLSSVFISPSTGFKSSNQLAHTFIASGTDLPYPTPPPHFPNMSSSLSELDATMFDSSASRNAKSASTSFNADSGSNSCSSSSSSSSRSGSSDADSDVDMSSSFEVSAAPKSKTKRIPQTSPAPAPSKKAPVKNVAASIPAKRKAATVAKNDKQDVENGDVNEEGSSESSNKSKVC